MPTSSHSIREAIGRLEAASVSVDRLDSKFVDAIVKNMPQSRETQESAAQLSSGLYRLLKRHHDDSLLIAGSSAALATAAEGEALGFIRKLTRFTKHMEGPVAMHSIKTLRSAGLVQLHPEVLGLKNIDTIQVLSRLPEGSVTRGEKKGEIKVGEVSIPIQGADPKDISSAVRRVKEAGTEIRKREKEAIRLERQAESEASDEESSEGDALRPQLSDAASALAKVIGSLSKTNADPQLSQVLDEARRLLVLAMRDEGYLRVAPHMEMAEEGDFH